jgi:hypothetical protein
VWGTPESDLDRVLASVIDAMAVLASVIELREPGGGGRQEFVDHVFGLLQITAPG